MTDPISRRNFLASSALAAGSLAAGASAAAGTRPHPRPGRPGPNEQIVLGFIGTGGMGRGLINRFKSFDDVKIGAVCDVYEPHALEAVSASGQSPDVYGDFRRVLDRDDLDAVVVATPDHWHAIPTIMACQAGKDVYCEKPLAWSIGEGGRVAKASEKYGRVTQMGNLIHATDNYHRIAELVQSGGLGKVTKARVWMARSAQDDIGSPPNGQPPSGCNYDMWLGPAPERPFNPNRFTFNWRFFWDYGGGFLSDFVCHLVDPVLWGMKATAPELVVAGGGRYVLDDNGETPDTLEVIYKFPEKWDLVWSLQSDAPHGFHGRGAGVEFVGTKGTLHGHYDDYTIIPNPGEEVVEPEPFLPRSQGHHREWLDKIKTRELCSCNFRYGHQLSAIGHMGNIAFRTEKALKWDAEAERFTNAEEANAYLFREQYRKPWALPEV
ncbi:Gfo/Idh/MocA family protein [Tautonia plasticadhaerens]|uniref:Inositol 2-dehydrogenase n=1 Tax=Tautonia plasticadhaerens TaxID=2527974 RepID=A0A518HB79_9BACT|nr:Gfo/Idh/MocA family oxidoreductase [Tautonia plasticadhaerens]QDV38113.1 Inositol 2-dehydrogenase [Tautonia plasticadhaerens]